MGDRKRAAKPSRRATRSGRDGGGRSTTRRSTPSATSGSIENLGALQRSVGNQAAMSVVQRDPPTASRTVTITINLPARHELSVKVGTVADLVEARNDLSSEMWFAEDDLMPDEEDNPYWEAFQTHRDDVDTVTDAYYRHYRDHADEPADTEEIRDLRAAVRTAERIGRRGYNDYRRRVAQAISQARRDAEAAHRKSQNALRAAFLTGASDAHPHIKTLWGIADKTQGLVTDLVGALAEEGTAIKSLSTITSRAFSLVNLVSDWQSANPGTFGTAAEGISDIRNAWSTASTAAGFANVPLKLVTSHIGPALAEIDKMLGKLSQQLREQNDDWVRFDGRPARPGVEPGGRDMWNYMVGVMHANSASEITPPTGGVYGYFDEFRDRFDEFNRARAKGMEEPEPGSMPTRSSWIIFSEADPSQLPNWVFSNRDMIWVSLYGSRPHAGAKPL